MAGHRGGVPQKLVHRGPLLGVPFRRGIRAHQLQRRGQPEAAAADAALPACQAAARAAGRAPLQAVGECHGRELRPDPPLQVYGLRDPHRALARVRLVRHQGGGGQRPKLGFQLRVCGGGLKFGRAVLGVPPLGGGDPLHGGVRGHHPHLGIRAPLRYLRDDRCCLALRIYDRERLQRRRPDGRGQFHVLPYDGHPQQVHEGEGAAAAPPLPPARLFPLRPLHTVHPAMARPLRPNEPCPQGGGAAERALAHPAEPQVLRRRRHGLHDGGVPAPAERDLHRLREHLRGGGLRGGALHHRKGHGGRQGRHHGQGQVLRGGHGVPGAAAHLQCHHGVAGAHLHPLPPRPHRHPGVPPRGAADAEEVRGQGDLQGGCDAVHRHRPRAPGPAHGGHHTKGQEFGLRRRGPHVGGDPLAVGRHVGRGGGAPHSQLLPPCRRQAEQNDRDRPQRD
mmetsp:Transcript_6673/g.23189  ORF Transcript_6673/g.23189 Transcript_6673/m.23189 type:complete len:449 (-) Transcript_6673:362-1708(-)